MKYNLTTPCADCPFRSDKPFLLARGRVAEIERGLERGDFPCHKTTTWDNEGESLNDRDREQHCAGALILLEKLDRPSQMMRICERLGLYDRRKLDMDAPVYDSWEAMKDGCRMRRRSKSTKT